MPPSNDDLNGLEQFLANTDNQTKADALAEIAARGVNATAFKTRVAEVVRKGYQQQVKLAAQEARLNTLQKANHRFGDLMGKSLAELVLIFERVSSGEFGPTSQEAALARCRNLQNENPSEAELRSWLEDISMLTDQ